MSNSIINKVIKMIRNDYNQMINDLESIKKMIDPTEHSDPNDPDSIPSIDVRLCIDIDQGEPNWIIRFGLSDFDQRHSDFCGASSVNIETNIDRDNDQTLESMIDQCLDQMSAVGES
jgi:hypothetical protein